MSKFLLLVTVAALGLGCVINDNGNDDGGDTGTSNASNATNATSNTTTATTNTTSATTNTTTATTDPSGTGESTDPTDASSTDPSADTGTTGGAACGWGRTGEKMVPMGYICGGDGEDPSGLMPISCPEGIELVEEGECGGETGITGVGCCDANGDVWYCADNGGGRALYTQDC